MDSKLQSDCRYSRLVMQSLTDAVPNLANTEPPHLPLATQLTKLRYLCKTLGTALDQIDTDQTQAPRQPHLVDTHAAYIMTFSSLVAAVVPQLVSLRLQSQQETQEPIRPSRTSISCTTLVITVLWDALVTACLGMQHWPMPWPSSANTTQLHRSLYSLTEWLLEVDMHSKEGDPFLNAQLRLAGLTNEDVLYQVQSVLHVHLCAIINLCKRHEGAQLFSSSLAQLPLDFCSILSSVFYKQLAGLSPARLRLFEAVAFEAFTFTWFQSLASGIVTIFNEAESAVDERVLANLAVPSVIEIMKLALCHQQEERLLPGYHCKDQDEYADSLIMKVLRVLMFRMHTSELHNSTEHYKPRSLTSHSRLVSLLTYRPAENTWQSQARWRLALHIISDWNTQGALDPEQTHSVLLCAHRCLFHGLTMLIKQRRRVQQQPHQQTGLLGPQQQQQRRDLLHEQTISDAVRQICFLWIPVAGHITASSALHTQLDTPGASLTPEVQQDGPIKSPPSRQSRDPDHKHRKEHVNLPRQQQVLLGMSMLPGVLCLTEQLCRCMGLPDVMQQQPYFTQQSSETILRFLSSGLPHVGSLPACLSFATIVHKAVHFNTHIAYQSNYSYIGKQQHEGQLSEAFNENHLQREIVEQMVHMQNDVVGRTICNILPAITQVSNIWAGLHGSNTSNMSDRKIPEESVATTTHPLASSPPALLPLHQLQAVLLASLVKLCLWKVKYETQRGASVHCIRVWLRDELPTFVPLLGGLSAMALQLLSYPVLSSPTADQLISLAWERYAVTHFHGRLLPGCCHLGCTNLEGVSEAVQRTLLCDGCRRARYCSVDCQRAAWLSGSHSSVCAK